MLVPGSIVLGYLKTPYPLEFFVMGDSMLSVVLLGVFRIPKADTHTWADLGPAGRGLASYLLAFPGRPHRRERLGDTFWPELDQQRARAALNSAVWRLRKIFASEPNSEGGRNLRTVGSEMILDQTDWLDIDAQALEKAANLMRSRPDALDASDLDRLITALNRYEGPFLDGDDGDWVLEERERLHSLFIHTVIRVVHHLATGEHYHDAITLTRRALFSDPYREELVRDLLGLLALDARRAEALRYYDNWSKALNCELGIVPLPATRELLAQIRAIQSPEALASLSVHLFSPQRATAANPAPPGATAAPPHNGATMMS
jgi:DNA-binding SARP family transcriptional activator